MPPPEQATKDWVYRFNEEVWGEQNLDAVDELVAETFVEHSISSGSAQPVHGPAGVRESVRAMLTAFPDSEVLLEDVVVEGDQVAIRARATGTHEGSFMGIDPTGNQIEVTVMAFHRVENGKAVEEWQLYESLGLLQQLGVVELPAREHDPRHHRYHERPDTTSTTTLDENKRIARRFPEEVATAGEIDRIDEICTADVIEHSPIGVLRGRDELKEQSRYIHTVFPDVSVAIEDTVAEGDLVAQRLTFRGTHEGEFIGVEPTGNEVEIANMLFTRIEDGRIAERWLLPDMLGLLQQLGVIDPPTG